MSLHHICVLWKGNTKGFQTPLHTYLHLETAPFLNARLLPTIIPRKCAIFAIQLQAQLKKTGSQQLSDRSTAEVRIWLIYMCPLGNTVDHTIVILHFRENNICFITCSPAIIPVIILATLKKQVGRSSGSNHIVRDKIRFRKTGRLLGKLHSAVLQFENDPIFPNFPFAAMTWLSFAA